jgi:Ser-tRNA(Ala) deacylase AlaX
MKSTIWISYDLGIRGDLTPFYAWLDQYNAKECGDSLAVIEYDHNDDLRDKIEGELKTLISENKRARIYLIYRDTNTKKNKGVFLFGSRKGAPWEGYAPRTTEVSDEEL